MRNIKLPILITVVVLALMSIPGVSTSCKIFTGGSGDISSDKESIEEVTEVEEVQETNTANIWISEAVPDFIRNEVEYELDRIFDETTIVRQKEDSDVWIEISAGSSDLGISYILVPVVSFFRVFDDISYNDIKRFWTGESEALNYLSIDGSDPKFIVTEEIYRILEEVWGPAGNDNISTVYKWQIPTDLENNNSFSIIPFEDIDKEYKVLELDDMSVFDKKLDIGSYPLAVGINVKSSDPEIAGMIEESFSDISITNRDTEELVSVIMTGVTAIVRQLARKIESDGVLSPGEEIKDVLKNADITHISNELPFVEGCDGTRPQGLVFCSRPEYIQLLRYVGTDVIELTGNHMNDFGHEWMNYTLDMYDEEGWPYFGGGRDLEDSYRPATFEIGNNKIAFLGANTFGPESDWATEDTPGSASIDVYDEVEKEKDIGKFEEIIKELKRKGYVVVFTFQYEETYSFSPTESQIDDFRRMIDAGADIVNGSQSHHPMGVEFRGEGFIIYGLGNLFFGQQLDILGNNPGIITKYILYKGKHINTILITTMLNDFSQPRLTTPEERVELLGSIFNGSIR
jgi:hypothetical protein